MLYDSTSFASKGHIAVNLPCNHNNPLDPIFDILVGCAPDLFVLPLGYIEPISKPGKMCVYHGQFGFGDPVTDLILQYVGDDPIKLEGPHSIVISYICEKNNDITIMSYSHFIYQLISNE